MKTIEWIMMGAFIGALGLSIWKVYAFFPNKRLSDDDTTPESVELLERIMVESYRKGISHSELYEAMLAHPDFDPKHFWRFNENRLRHLIDHYRFKDPNFCL
ncbi:hypothetical protein [Sulfuricurvum sp.]|uniref:hypothetical protein n=1 Tax=Sulfuricurvum sp. TaxID=2025608 RepID=UPI0019CC211E|nr:hypothetical protein [Sulfuricurvum sp.]MBD3799380.1 hypothetical protein [Campylobacterota bacterium]MBD3806793.1 hypothetical protein [Sulfuricurvum sp.]